MGIMRSIAWLGLVTFWFGCRGEPDQLPASPPTSAVPAPPKAPPIDWNATAARGFELWGALKKDQNEVEAQRLFRDACDHKSELGCAGLGITYIWGVNGTGKDGMKGLKLLSEACEANIPRGCYALGQVYENGAGVPRDSKKALELVRRACDGGEQRGCVAYASFLIDGDENVIKDPKQGFEIAKAACEKGEQMGCTVEGQAFLFGWGVKKDPAKAKPLLEQACNREDGAGCLALADMHFDGLGIAKAPKLGVEFSTRACDVGFADGCARLAAAIDDGEGVKRDPQRAKPIAEKACDDNAGYGCTLAGTIARRAGNSGEAASFSSARANSARMPHASCRHFGQRRSRRAGRGVCDRPESLDRSIGAVEAVSPTSARDQRRTRSVTIPRWL